MFKDRKVVVIMPTYNAHKTLKITVDDIPRDMVDEIFVINDASADDTAEIAKTLPVTLITHPKNTGYGGSQKTGYAEALKRGADIVIMVHGDYQYDPKCIPAILEAFSDENVDAVFGSRMYHKSWALQGGMPWWRFVANIGLSLLEEMIFHLKLTEYHSGYRAYSAQVLRAIPYELDSNGHLFDADISAQLAIGGFKVAEVPIPTRYEEQSLSMSFGKCVRYGFDVLGLIGKYLLHRLGFIHYPLLVVTPKHALHPTSS